MRIHRFSKSQQDVFLAPVRSWRGDVDRSDDGEPELQGRWAVAVAVPDIHPFAADGG